MRSFWLDFEHEVSEWKINETEKTSDTEDVMLIYKDHELNEVRRKGINSWIENNADEYT